MSLTRGKLLLSAQPGRRNKTAPALKSRAIKAALARSAVPVSAVNKLNPLMLVYRLLVQSLRCDPFFHNALEEERQCASTPAQSHVLAEWAGQSRREKRDRTQLHLFPQCKITGKPLPRSLWDVCSPHGTSRPGPSLCCDPTYCLHQVKQADTTCWQHNYR